MPITGTPMMLSPPNGTPATVKLEREQSLDCNLTPFADGLDLERKGEKGGIEQQLVHAASIKALRTHPNVASSMGAVDTALLFPGTSLSKPTPEQVDENLELLHTVLHKLARFDVEKCFVEPVTEQQAPGYFKIIKHPMCLRMMHQKLDAREYRTWRSFIDDFVLICTNALTYNQKRSRVHRAALQLMRQGKKLLSDHELVARRALTMVHPDGPAQATMEEQQDLLTNGLALVPSSPLAADTPTSDVPQRATSLHLNGSAAGDTQGLSLNTDELVFGYASSEEGNGYSSFSDTDMSGDEDEQAAPPPLPPRSNASVSNDNSLFAAVPAAGPRRSLSWKAAQRDLERRCRWLELRLRGLHSSAATCRAGLDDSGDEEDGRVLMQVDGAATPSEPSPPTTARRRSARNHQAAAPRKANHRAVRGVPKELGAATDVPFVAAHLQLRQHVPLDVHPLEEEPDACLPARVYAALELVERQIAAVRKHLHTTAHHHSMEDRKRSAMRGGRGSRGLARPSSGRGRGWQGRSDSFGNKRRRLEYGVHEMVATHKLLAPKFVEKAQVTPIATPGFRTLPETELKQRTAAVTALAKRHHLPAEVAKALADESSSDEDTSDEAYEQRHHQREQEEKDWYAQYTAGNLQKNLKNKTSKRGTASKVSKPPGEGPSGSGVPSTAADTTADTATVAEGGPRTDTVAPTRRTRSSPPQDVQVKKGSVKAEDKRGGRNGRQQARATNGRARNTPRGRGQQQQQQRTTRARASRSP